MRITRRGVLGLALALSGAAALADAPLRAPEPKTRPGLAAPGADRAIAEDRSYSGELGYVVVDVATGEVIEARQENRGFPPASVVKAVTALYALDVLGPGHRFETRLLAVGDRRGGVLRGDLYLEGGGDPELDSDDLMDLAQQAATFGLARVDGRFLVDASALPTLERIDDGQPEYVAYNPSVSGLNLNFNRVLFEWARGATDLSLQARALRASPVVNTVAIGQAQSVPGVFDYDPRGAAETWLVSSAALKREGKRWLPVRRPVAYAGDVFRTLARDAGLILPQAAAGEAPPRGVVAGRVESRPLRDMARLMLKHSTNLTAEALGLSASRARGRPADDLAASGAEMEDWARAYAGLGAAATPGSLFSAALADGPSIRFANHSGLSPDTSISPLQLARILVAAEAKEGGALREILQPLDLKARKGELGATRPVKGWAKTGTMNFVRGLGGYIDAASGRRLAFVIFAEDLERRAAADAGRERPRGARTWAARARAMERRLTLNWAARY